MRLSAMGDVAMTVPVLRAFAAQYPDIKITVISRPFFKPLFAGIPNLNFFAFDAKRHNGFWGLPRLYHDLQPLKIDAFADLHNVLRSKVIRTLFDLSGKKTASVDKARRAKRKLTKPTDKIFEPLPTMFQRHAGVFGTLGFTVDLSNPVFPSKLELTSEVLQITGEKSRKWIGIAPFAQYESKVYPADLMQNVIDTLAENPQYHLFLFGGGKKEIEKLNKFSHNKSNITVVAGKLKFEQELQLISNLDLMLSMDSGNAHIAAMFGIKVVTLWGATHPFTGFSPFAQPLENALVSDRKKFPALPTSVYGNKKVAGYEDAMRTISPESVVSKITKLLTEKP